MFCKTISPVVSLVLLTGLLSGSPATAQITYAPEPTVPTTLEDIQVCPPELSLFPALRGLPLQFEVRNGRLFLTRLVEGVVENNKTEVDVWSSGISKEPQKFTFTTSKTEEELKDSTGKMIWSQHFDEPSLTLAFDHRGHVLLKNSAGNVLGSGPDSYLPMNVAPIFPVGRPHTNVSTFDDIRIETNTQQQTTTVYSGSHLIWAGRRPANDGVRYGDSPDSPVEDIPAPQYPVGTGFEFEIGYETGSMAISDREHHPLETVPTETLRLITLDGQDKLRDHQRNYFLYHLPPAITQASLFVPGQIRVQYHSATGEWASEETIHVMKETRQFAHEQKSAHERKSETDLEVWIANFDQNGNRTGSQQYVEFAKYNYD